MKRFPTRSLLFFLPFLALLLAACAGQQADTAESAVQAQDTAEEEAQAQDTGQNEAQAPDAAKSEAQPDAVEEETQPSKAVGNKALDLDERIEFSGFGFSIAYPSGWTAGERIPVTIINELASDHETAFGDELPDREGIEVSLDRRTMNFMRSLDLPEEASLQDLFEINRNFFEWPAALEAAETELFGAPALVISTNEDGVWAQSLMGFTNDQAFLLTLSAPSKEALDTFLPTWEQMLAGIKPVAAVEAPADTAADEPMIYELLADTPLADFGFSMPYPAGWYAAARENQLTISNTEGQLDPPLTQPPIEGYSIDFFHDPLAALQAGGLTADPAPQDVLDLLVASFGAEAPTAIEELTLFDVSAVRAQSSISFEGEAAHPFEVTTGIRDGSVFVLVLHARNAQELDAFLPSWREMVDGIEPQ